MTTQALVGLARFLEDKGFAQNVTAAVVANAHHESGGNPAALGDNGTSVGLFQWHDDRAQGLLDFARRQGVSPKAPETQYAYLLRELQSDYPELVRRMSQTGSAAKAADLFQRHFERPKEIDPARSETATAVSEWIDKRRKRDQEAAALRQQVPSAAALVEPARGVVEPPGAPTAAPAALPGVSMVEAAPGAGPATADGARTAVMSPGVSAADLIEQFMNMGSGPTNKGPLGGLPIGQTLMIPPRVTAFFGNTPATDEVRKLGFGRAIEEGDYRDDVSGFLKDAGGLVSRAMRKAGFAPEPPSRAVYGDAPGISRAERAALDQEAGRQFIAEAAAVIAKTPGWYSLDRKTQRDLLEKAHKAAVSKATYPGLMQSYSPSRKRPVPRVTLGPAVS